MTKMFHLAWFTLPMIAVAGCTAAEPEAEEDPPAEAQPAAEDVAAAIQMAEMASSIYAVASAGPPALTAYTGGDDGGGGGDDGGGGDGGGLGLGCAEITWNGTTLRADFGPPPGCPIGFGLAASGAISVTVSQSPPAAGMGFESFSLGGMPVTGSLAFTEVSTSVREITTNLERGGERFDLDITFDRAEGAPSVTDGLVEHTLSAGHVRALELEAITRQPGDCLPSAGSAAVSELGLELRLTFTSDTPITGEVQVTWTGGGKATLILPHNGPDCRLQ